MSHFSPNLITVFICKTSASWCNTRTRLPCAGSDIVFSLEDSERGRSLYPFLFPPINVGRSKPRGYVYYSLSYSGNIRAMKLDDDTCKRLQDDLSNLASHVRGVRIFKKTTPIQFRVSFYQKIQSPHPHPPPRISRALIRPRRSIP